MKAVWNFAIVLVCTSGPALGQSLQSGQYGGTWTYEKGKGPEGILLVYPESDSTVLFYVDLNIGPPSYNSGAMYDRLIIRNGHGVFESDSEQCKWTADFTGERLKIRTVDNLNECGFGGNVCIDGSLFRKSKTIPDHFETGEGKIFYFKSTSPEAYHQ